MSCFIYHSILAAVMLLSPSVSIMGPAARASLLKYVPASAPYITNMSQQDLARSAQISGAAIHIVMLLWFLWHLLSGSSVKAAGRPKRD